ncbi:protein phosphatase 2C domain-containing protein [Marinactinospora rubrisoli]|uniref:Protein phosphatase 2C domain-containing protein n=1 Tax=Marinactinospora rubrisoli TaxID=2715399 RepID=A0ABW2KNE6_9ACTN
MATAPGNPARPMEDWAGATDTAVVVLDGLSAPEGTSCRHGTPWFVRQLGPRLLTHASQPEVTLRQALAAAIREVAALHEDTCDLSHPATPSTTVAMARRCGGDLQALVVADSSVVVATTENMVDVLSDSRVDDAARSESQAALAAPAGPERDRRVADLVRVQQQLRNRAGGYWVVQADPDVADHAVTRTWPIASVRRVALLTDGATRLVDTFDALSWPDLLDLIASRGPGALITETRRLEAQDPRAVRWPRYKRADDAAVIDWAP